MEGDRVPALDRRKPVMVHLKWVWEAFGVLSNARPSGFDTGRIPVSEMRAYADMIGLRPDERAEFVALISRMDAAWLEFVAKKRPKG